ncbi:MAG: TetR/AcrR family transcriptional regulator [Candidatus Acidiferrales bacterium]
MPRGRKKIAHPEAARRILAAAERIFAAEGLAGARTDEIAAAARVNKAMLYYYFGDKERLYRAVLENLILQLSASVEAASTHVDSPRGQLLAFLDAYFEFLAGHPAYPRLIQRETMRSGGHLDWIVRDFFRPSHQRMVRLIERGIRKREFRRVDAHHAVFTIISMCVFYFSAAPVLSRVMRRDTLRPESVAARRRAVLDFISHGLFVNHARSA